VSADTDMPRLTPTDRAISVLRTDMNRLRGKLFGAVEAAGLPDKQENALKGLVRQLTYDAQGNLEATLRRGEPT
jgi:hypothetical protein